MSSMKPPRRTLILIAIVKYGGAILVEGYAAAAQSVCCLDTVSYTHLTLPTNREV